MYQGWRLDAVFSQQIRARTHRSLYVTLESVSLAQSIFVNNDLRMYDEDTDIPAVCRSTNLCQEIGQVEYIFRFALGLGLGYIFRFDCVARSRERTSTLCVQTRQRCVCCSDKTGTLTRNEM